MKYFLKNFFIYLLFLSGIFFITLDNNIADLSGKDVDSTVEFVYEAF